MKPRFRTLEHKGLPPETDCCFCKALTDCEWEVKWNDAQDWKPLCKECASWLLASHDLIMYPCDE